MSSLTKAAFSYQPLAEPDAIRLVLLHRRLNVSAPLECSIVYTTLSHCDEDLNNHYIAISYVWGDQTNTRLIVVDSCSFRITANLDSALRHIRDTKTILRV